MSQQICKFDVNTVFVVVSSELLCVRNFNRGDNDVLQSVSVVREQVQIVSLS